MNNENFQQPNTGGDPISPQEFAKKIKSQYPEYKDVDDLTLAKKMVEKYPEYRNKVNFNTPVQPKKVIAGGNGASPSASATGGSLSGLPRPKTTLIQRMQEEQMSRPKVGQEQKPVSRVDAKIKEDVKKQQEVWNSNKPLAKKVSQSVTPASKAVFSETPSTASETPYVTNSIENYVDRHKEAYKYDYDYYKPVDTKELMNVTDNFDGIEELSINSRDFANFLKNKTNYFKQDFKYDSETQQQFAYNEYINSYLQDRATYLKNKYVMADPETRKEIIDESKTLGADYETFKKRVMPAYYKAEQEKKAKNREFYEDVKNGKNFLTDAKTTGVNLVKGATYALSDLVSSAADITGFDDFADKLRFQKKFFEWSDENGTVTYAKGKNVKFKGNDYLVTDTGNIIDKQTKTSVNSFIDKKDMDNIYNLAEQSKTDDSVYSGRGYTYALANTVGNLAFQVVATRGIGGAAGKVGLTEANVGKIAATAPEMVAVGSMVASSTYNDTLEQLRKAGVSDEIAKGEAGKVAAYTAAAGMIVTKFLPNTNANKILTSELNNGELIKQTIAAFSSGGSKGVSDFLKNSAKNIIFKSPEVLKEGAGEMFQELMENSAQKQANYWVNSKLDQKILSTDWTKQEILDTAILSFAAGGMLGGLGKTRESFLGNNIQDNFDMLSALEPAKLDQQGQVLIDKGDLTREQFDQFKNKVQNYRAYKNKLTEDVKGKTAVEVTQLMAERDKLKQDKKNLDEAFHPEIDAKIESVNGKINEILTNPISEDEETTTETTETGAPEGQENTEGQAESKEESLIKNEKLLKYLKEDIKLPQEVLNALPQDLSLTFTMLMGDKNDNILGRVITTAVAVGGYRNVQAEANTNTGEVTYDRNPGEIQLNTLHMLGKFLLGKDEKYGNRVVFHEAVHAASVITMNDMSIYMQNEEYQKSGKYSQEQLDARQRLSDTFKTLKKQVNKGGKQFRIGTSLYGMTNEYEFVAEFISNPDFKKWVADESNESFRRHNDGQKRNILQHIWDDIKIMLGIKDRKINTAFQEQIDKDINTVFKAQRDNFTKYNPKYESNTTNTSAETNQETTGNQEGENTSNESVLPTESTQEEIPPLRLTEEVSQKVKEVGTEEEYKQYVNSIHPESQIVGHHLSKNSFDEFNEEYTDSKGKIKKNTAYYFTDKDSAEDYKEVYGDNEKAASLDLKNPVVVDYDYSGDENSLSHKLEFLTEDFKNDLIDRGFDGAIINRGDEKEYIVFSKDQIHVLGTDKDIESFRKWKDSNLLSEDDFKNIDLSDQLGLNKAEDFLNNISKKLDDFGKGTLGMNIPVTVLRGAIAAMKVAVKTAKVGADVISAGVNYVRQTQWYKNLDEDGKKEFDSKSILSHLSDLDNKKIAEAMVKRETTGNKPLKTSIREVTGQKDQSKKITQSESQLLRDKFKNLERGFKQGVKDTQALKKEFIDQVKQSIKGLGNFITETDTKTILNQVGNVNEKNLDKVSEVIDNLVSRLENRAQKARTNRLSKLQKRAGVKARTKYGNAGGNINKLIKLPANQIPEASYDEYYDMMEKLAKGEAVDFNQVDSLYESLQDDIQKFIENKNENKNKPKEPEAEYSRKEKQDSFKAAYNAGKRNTDNLTDFERKIVKDFFEIPSDYLENLSSEKLGQITKSLDFLSTTGYLPNKVISDVVMKYKSEVTASDIMGKVGETVLKPVKKFTDMINQARGKEYLSDDFFKKISNNMLHHIDSTIKGIKGTTFYDNIVHPITSGFNKSDAETNKIGHEASNLLSKAAKKVGTGFKTNVRLQMFLRAREFESNPELRGTKVFSLDEHMRALEDNKNNVEYSSADMDVINDVYEQFKGINSEEMFNKLTPEEKTLVEFMDKKLREQEITNRDYNNHLLGETLTYPVNYFPRKNSFVSGNEDTDNEVKSRLFGMIGATSVKGDASNERVATQANPLDFNTMNNFMKSVRESNIEKNLAFSVKQTLMTISNLKKSDNESLVRVANALERTVKNLLEIQLNKNPYSYDSKTEQLFNKFVRNTFTRMLIDPIRLTYDVASNYSTVYAAFGDKLSEIIKASKNISDDVTAEIHKNISSTQSERMGGSRSSDYKNAMNTPLSKASNKKAEPSFGERIVDLYKHNKLSEFSEAMGDIYYKYADLPAQHLWKYFLTDEYNKLTGSEFDGKKYLSDKNYREEIQDDLQKAAVTADKKTANYFNTGSSSEQKLKVQAGRDNWFNRMNNFLRSFTFNENKVFWDSLNGLTGFGNTTFDNRSDAFRAFTVINARGIMYAYLGQVIGDWLTKFVTDDEEEEEILNKKALKRSLGQHGMLIALGNKGAVANFMGTFLGEMINQEVVKAEKGKYNAFEDNIFFTPNKKSKYVDFLNNLGAEGLAVKTLVESGDISLKIVEKYWKGEEITKEDLIKMKAARISTSMVSQTFGLPIDRLGRLTQKALEKKYGVGKGKEGGSSKKNKGFNSFGSGFGSFK